MILLAGFRSNIMSNRSSHLEEIRSCFGIVFLRYPNVLLIEFHKPGPMILVVNGYSPFFSKYKNMQPMDHTSSALLRIGGACDGLDVAQS